MKKEANRKSGLMEKATAKKKKTAQKCNQNWREEAKLKKRPTVTGVGGNIKTKKSNMLQ